MIACIVVGSLAALGVARFVHRRLHGGWGYGGCGQGWRGGPWDGMGGQEGDLGGDDLDWMEARRGWHGHHHHGPFRFGRWGGGHGPMPFGPGRTFILRSVLRRLETTPTQERALRDAAREFGDSAKSWKGEVRRSRADVAAAFRRTAVDEVALGELFARHDSALDGIRKAFVGLMIKVHETLDDTQRERLAQLIEIGPRWFRSSPTAAW